MVGGSPGFGIMRQLARRSRRKALAQQARSYNRKARGGLMADTTGFFADRYGVDAKLMNDILAVALRTAATTRSSTSSTGRPARSLFEEQAVKTPARSATQGVGVRVLQRRRHRLRLHRGPDARGDAPGRRDGRADRQPTRRVGPVAVGPRSRPDLYPVQRPFWDALARRQGRPHPPRRRRGARATTR